MVIDHWTSGITQRELAGWYHYVFDKFGYPSSSKSQRVFNGFRQFERLKGELNGMAKKQENKGHKPAMGTNSIRWVNQRILDEMYPAFDEFMDSQFRDFVGYLCNFASEGVSVSLKRGTDNDFMCTFIWRNVGDNSDETIGLSTFASTPEDALGGNIFKYIVLLDNGKSVPVSDDGGKRRVR